MNDVRLVVLAHYQDIFSGFYETCNRWWPEGRKILVRDGTDVVPTQDWHWLTLNAPTPFIYSRNVNVGLNDAFPHDVILCGDDVRFVQPFAEKLQEVAYSDPTIGICVPQLYGQSPFVCGYFKRSMLDRVGPMDEGFVGYGFDDNDFCHRMELCGFRTHPTTDVFVKHEAATTFRRRETEGGYNVPKSCEKNRERYEAKWGNPGDGETRKPWVSQ